MKKIYYLIIFLFLLGAVAFYFFDKKYTHLVIINNKEENIEIKGKKYFVSPSGNDSNDGFSEEKPLLTIQNAIDMLEPGDGLILADGFYFQDFITRRDGTEDRKIVIMGSEKAVVKGSKKNSRIIEINHDYHLLVGFSVDGLDGNKEDKKNYQDKLIYISGTDPLEGVFGVKILRMNIKNAGGECLRIKYFSKKNEVAYNKITGCGAFDFIFKKGGKNGEGIYIGTAPEQTEEKNPTADVDKSDNNWIHDNIIDTQGNECVDIKEGSSNNLIENNKCTGQKDKESAGLDSRGSGNIFRNNEVFGNVGAGIRLGGDEEDDGINNLVENNYLHNNESGGIKIQRKPQKSICGNRFSDNKKGELVGEYGSDSKNEKKCGN